MKYYKKLFVTSLVALSMTFSGALSSVANAYATDIEKTEITYTNEDDYSPDVEFPIDIIYNFNDNDYNLDLPTIVYKERVYIPFVNFFESIAYEVVSNEELQTYKVFYDKKTLELDALNGTFTIVDGSKILIYDFVTSPIINQYDVTYLAIDSFLYYLDLTANTDSDGVVVSKIFIVDRTIDLLPKPNTTYSIAENVLRYSSTKYDVPQQVVGGMDYLFSLKDPKLEKEPTDIDFSAKVDGVFLNEVGTADIELLMNLDEIKNSLSFENKIIMNLLKDIKLKMVYDNVEGEFNFNLGQLNPLISILMGDFLSESFDIWLNYDFGEVCEELGVDYKGLLTNSKTMSLDEYITFFVQTINVATHYDEDILNLIAQKFKVALSDKRFVKTEYGYTNFYSENFNHLNEVFDFATKLDVFTDDNGVVTGYETIVDIIFANNVKVRFLVHDDLESVSFDVDFDLNEIFEYSIVGDFKTSETDVMPDASISENAKIIDIVEKLKKK